MSINWGLVGAKCLTQNLASLHGQWATALECDFLLHPLEPIVDVLVYFYLYLIDSEFELDLLPPLNFNCFLKPHPQVSNGEMYITVCYMGDLEMKL